MPKHFQLKEYLNVKFKEIVHTNMYFLLILGLFTLNIVSGHGSGAGAALCLHMDVDKDVVVVGCSDGKIHVHNIRYDQEVVSFTHSTLGAVTALSFCTDGQPLLASGGSSGVISIWNLEKKRIQSVIKDAYDSSIISLHFFANEPVLMSASVDNSIKDHARGSNRQAEMWQVDQL